MRGGLKRLASGLFVLVLAVWLACGAGFAQTSPPPVDFDAWEQVAERAEAAVEAGAASERVFTDLRAEVAEWRERLLAAQTTNADRLETLAAQVTALGPVPAEGASEPDVVADRRSELNDRIAELEVPRLAADEGYSRANGLITEIDRLLRERQNEEIFQIGASPLKPTLWAPAVVAMGSTLREFAAEVTDRWSQESIRRDAIAAHPLTIGLLILSVLLVWQGRRLMDHLTTRAQSRERAEGRDVLVFLVSIGQVLIPVIGLLVLTFALLLTGLVGDRGKVLVSLLPGMGFTILAARWLGYRVFPKSDAVSAPIELSPEARTEGRWYTVTLGILLSITTLLTAIAEFPEHSRDTIVVLAFPLAVVGGLMLFRLGQFLRRSTAAEGEDSEPGLFKAALRTVATAIMVIGIGAPALAAFGYLVAAERVLVPTVMTLALVAFLSVVHAPIRDIYALISRRSDAEAREALVPVLVTFTLTLASLPLLALIWGAREAELVEIWSRFRGGVAVGDTRIAPGDFLTFMVVFLLGYGLTRMVQGTLRSAVLPKTRIDPGGRNAITSGVGYLGIFLAALAAITSAGIDLSSIAIVAGALSVGIGFGLQNIVSNFVSGIILLIERPIGEGDWIEVNGQQGIVQSISVRSTRIETFDKTDVIVPNADFVSGSVTNWTRGNLVGRVTVSVGVGYGSDSRRVEELLREICEAHPLVSMNPPPKVFFRRFGADALEFDCFCVLRDIYQKLVVHSELNHQIHERFRAEGIEIPFAQRDLWLRNPEALARPPTTGPRASRRPDDTEPGRDEIGQGPGDEDGD